VFFFRNSSLSWDVHATLRNFYLKNLLQTQIKQAEGRVIIKDMMVLFLSSEELSPKDCSIHIEERQSRESF